MWKTCFSIFSILLLSTQQPAPPSKAAHLKAFDFLTGCTWKAEGEIAGFGKYTAERTYRWSPDSAFIEQHHSMKLKGGSVEAIAFLSRDPAKERVVAYGFGNDGGVATTATTAEKQTIVFEGARVGGFNPGPVRGTFTIKNDYEFTESVEVQMQGK